MTKTVATATAMNTQVATSERGERRARPQTPCPLVQPPPYPDPNPTSSPPAKANVQVKDVSVNVRAMNSTPMNLAAWLC